MVALREYKDRLDRLSKQVMKLERQYEKKRPLINLLDNMVKLGALYQNRKKSLRRSQTILETKTQPREQLQFLRDAQERNILKDERQYWTENNPNQRDLQQKVNKLFKLEQAIQNESNMLHDFQKNKLNIKGKLNELNNVSNNKIMSTAALFDQQMKKDYLEQELSGVHDHMATKSRVSVDQSTISFDLVANSSFNFSRFRNWNEKYREIYVWKMNCWRSNRNSKSVMHRKWVTLKLDPVVSSPTSCPQVPSYSIN